MTHHIPMKTLITTLMVVLSSGCFQNKVLELTLAEVKQEISAINEYNLSTNHRIEDLNKTVTTMANKVEQNTGSVRELRETLPSIGGAEAKEGLEEPEKSVDPQSIQETTTEAMVGREVPPPLDPQALYLKAFNEFKSGDYGQAIVDFTTVTREFSDHDYADNAQYWLGEIYYVQKNFHGAIIAFKKVPKEYPNGNKVPDALLKVGFSYLNLGDFKNAENYLQMVMDMYPFSDAARKADIRLGKMEQ